MESDANNAVKIVHGIIETCVLSMINSLRSQFYNAAYT